MERGRWDRRAGWTTNRQTNRQTHEKTRERTVVGWRTSQKEFVSIYASRSKFDKMTDMLHIKTTESQYYMRTPDRWELGKYMYLWCPSGCSGCWAHGTSLSSRRRLRIATIKSMAPRLLAGPPKPEAKALIAAATVNSPCSIKRVWRRKNWKSIYILFWLYFSQSWMIE